MGRCCEDPYQFDLIHEENCIKYLMELKRESDEGEIEKVDQRKQ